MRCLVKQGDKWVQEHPADLERWLWDKDGEEAVVIDDKRVKIFYCATEELKTQYEAEGKKALMFYDLGKLLYEQSH